jgi:UDP-N-acetylmuramate: L-alanyl-gamma-D-glutamyl-meso-diaminopimelate ligase
MHYHLIGICGTAMASLAGMLQARGHKVTGSDQNVYPPMSTQLEQLGIEIMTGYKAENTDLPRDITVVGNTIMRGNPELEEVLNRKLVYRSQAEVVREEFIRGRKSMVVAGTHGKTTTTSIAAWVCEVGGLDPTFLVGGVVQNFGQSFRVTDSDYFVIEGDEYWPSSIRQISKAPRWTCSARPKWARRCQIRAITLISRSRVGW